jgi:8-oxo-dGTP pyrophosphatase MutT (NUDIX family)
MFYAAVTKRDLPMYCNNCGKYGHSYSHCKNLITSYGVIAFRWNPELREFQYLMICRKNTLGYMDFIRGKYIPNDLDYIYNMVSQMTLMESKMILDGDFDQLWTSAFGSNNAEQSQIPQTPVTQTLVEVDTSNNTLRHEKMISQEKYKQLNTKVFNNGIHALTSLVKKNITRGNCWKEPEWGFPKGRRNYRETDYECAIREFCEETGISAKVLKNVHNVVPFEEMFMGSNYKSYKHRYYLVYIPYVESLNTEGFERAEVSKMEWKTFGECLRDIRPYNLEKRRIIENVNEVLRRYMFVRE